MSFHEQFWSSRYREVGEDYLFGTAPTRFMERHAHYLTSGNSALSVADGEGRNSVWLAEQGLKVLALDISPVGIEKARKLAAGRGVTVDFILGDVFNWTWPEAAFDYVVAVFIQFAAPSERARLFADMARALKPGGLLLLHGYTPQQVVYKTGGPPSPEHMYTVPLLRDAFAGWEFLELREYEEHLEEGLGHRGRSALIDLVARKTTDQGV